MSSDDSDLFGTMVRVENKDIFIDLKKNKSGVYLKISERNGSSRSTILIPASGIPRLQSALQEASKENSKAKASKPGSKERKNRIASDPGISSRSVYVTGLAWETTDEDLAEYFSQSGTVRKAVVLRQRRGGRDRSMGCGVVELSSEEEASRAIESLNETSFKDRVIRCREDRTPAGGDEAVEEEEFAPEKEGTKGRRTRKPRGKKGGSSEKEGNEDSAAETPKVADPNKIFITNLPWECTEEDLTAFFSEAGHITKVELLKTRKGRSVGSGNVEFADSASVQIAVEKMNKKDLQGRPIGIREYFNK